MQAMQHSNNELSLVFLLSGSTKAVGWTSSVRGDRVFCISAECNHSELTSGYTMDTEPLGFYGATEVTTTCVFVVTFQFLCGKIIRELWPLLLRMHSWALSRVDGV